MTRPSPICANVHCPRPDRSTGRASETGFADQVAWQAHLNRLGIAAMDQWRHPDPCRSPPKAPWGSIHAHGFLRDAVVLSDDAGQFAVGRHALCWVHAERLVHKLDTFTDQHRPRSSACAS